MRILIATSELHPYSKSGGLADMVAALTKSLARKDNKVGVITPLYRGLRERFPDISSLDWKLQIPLGTSVVEGEVWTLEQGCGTTVYFIDQPDFFDRPGLYQDNGSSYSDNANRFTFFCKAVIQLAKHLDWQPELLHLHDWQTGLVPLLMIHNRLVEGWGTPPATCLTIHNMAYQGIFPASAFRLTNLPQEYFNIHSTEFFGLLNCLKAGLYHADVLTTVSPRYAREIMTPALGCGLDGVLRERQDHLVGILNGVDYDEWNTNRNPHLDSLFTSRRLNEGKQENKLALQKECQLPVNPDVPLFANISRLADQKGMDILRDALEELLKQDIQFVQLASGDPELETAFRQLAKRYSKKAAIRLEFDHAFSHRIEAGADFFVMPSRFEPCGLNQMYSLRYGTIPIVRSTGGLDDTVIDATEDLEGANGIKFLEYSKDALVLAFDKALELYRHSELMDRYRHNGIKANFSWARTAQRYMQIYRNALRAHPDHGLKLC